MTVKCPEMVPEQFAENLVEALPYIRRFRGSTVVIKYGGHAMTDEEIKMDFCEDIVLLSYVGIKPIVVHGGGPMITHMLDRLGKEAQFIEGLRVTDAESLEVVEMVLVGQIRGEITSRINQAGGRAVGLSGRDGKLVLAEKLRMKSRSKKGKKEDFIDIGFVGKIKSIQPDILRTLDDHGFIPVISPLGVGEDGESYNINADHMAGEIAASIPARKLIMLTDTPGILQDHKDPKTLISTIHIKDIPKLIDSHIITTGMLPKIEACETALRGGINKAHIIDGRVPHAILLELFTNRGVGTQIIGDHTVEED